MGAAFGAKDCGQGAITAAHLAGTANLSMAGYGEAAIMAAEDLGLPPWPLAPASGPFDGSLEERGKLNQLGKFASTSTNHTGAPGGCASSLHARVDLLRAGDTG